MKPNGGYEKKGYVTMSFEGTFNNADAEYDKSRPKGRVYL